jgi:hypothetical protein
MATPPRRPQSLSRLDRRLWDLIAGSSSGDAKSTPRRRGHEWQKDLIDDLAQEVVGHGSPGDQELVAQKVTGQ